MTKLSMLAAAARAAALPPSGGNNGGTVTPGEMFAAVTYTGDNSKLRKVTHNVAGAGTWLGMAEIPQSTVLVTIPHPAPGFIGNMTITLAGGGGGAGAYWPPDGYSGVPASGQTAQWTYNAKGDELYFTAQHVGWSGSTSTLTFTVIGGANNGKTLCVGGSESNNGGYGTSGTAIDRTALSTLTATKVFSGACRPYDSTIYYSDNTSYGPQAPASYGNSQTSTTINGMSFTLYGATSPGGVLIDGTNFGHAHKTGPGGAAGTPQSGVVIIAAVPATAIVNPVCMTWIKQRNTSTDHVLIDSVRGPKNEAYLTVALPVNVSNDVRTFTPDGFFLGAGALNTAAPYSAVTFKKNPNFFDIVTWAGNGASVRGIAHGLGSKPGMMLIKSIVGNTSSWYVYHASLGINYLGQLNVAAGFGNSPQAFGNSEPNSNSAYFGDVLNVSGTSYIAYLFGDDTSASSMIRCGQFTVNGTRDNIIDLGWDAQFVLCKSVANADDWRMVDMSREFSMTSQVLQAQSATPEVATNGWLLPDPNGFALGAAGYNAGTQVVYLAVRRSLIAPTSGTQVYKSAIRTGTGVALNYSGVGFAPDLHMGENRNGGTGGSTPMFTDRVRGKNQYINGAAASPEAAGSDMLTSFNQDGVTFGSQYLWNESGISRIEHFFKRARGVFDIVTYVGDGVVARYVKHNLGVNNDVTPELVLIKPRTSTADWTGFTNLNEGSGPDAVRVLSLNQSSPSLNGIAGQGWGGPYSFLAQNNGPYVMNTTGVKYVAYLFASKAGISKVGVYNGLGVTPIQIPCGFTNGARFVLIKRVDAAGDWIYFDTSRGILSGNDPSLALNKTAAEISADSIAPLAAGFTVQANNANTNLNASGATYIFLAIA